MNIVKNKYMIVALVMLFLSLCSCFIVYQWSMKLYNITVEVIQLMCGLVSLICIFDCIIKRGNVVIYKIIAQSFICFILGELYWVLHLYIKGYEQIGSFSISDLSWIGFYILLFSASYNVLRPLIEKGISVPIKYSFISMIAPILILASSITLFLKGDNIFYTIIYLIPTALLSYFTMKYILLSYNNLGNLKSFRSYNYVVALILLLDNLICLSVSFGFEDAEDILKFGFAMALLLIVPAMYKGVEECQV